MKTLKKNPPKSKYTKQPNAESYLWASFSPYEPAKLDENVRKNDDKDEGLAVINNIQF